MVVAYSLELILEVKCKTWQLLISGCVVGRKLTKEGNLGVQNL